MTAYDVVAVPARFITLTLRPVLADWSYDPADPLAVRLTLFPKGGPVEEWRFARQLLGAAFLGPIGEGDVHLATRKAKLVVTLRPPDGHLTLLGDAEVAWDFLQSSFDACPPCPGTDKAWHAYCAECATVEAVLDRALEQILEATP